MLPYFAHPEEAEALLPLVTPKFFKNSRLNKIILVTSPGNLASPELVESIKSGFKVNDVFITFGIPEPCGVMTMTQANTTLQPSLIGQPLPHTEVKIIDKNGATVSLGTPGELAVKGFNVTQGYKGENEINARKFKNGFLHTGIKAKLDTNKNVIVNSN